MLHNQNTWQITKKFNYLIIDLYFVSAFHDFLWLENFYFTYISLVTYGATFIFIHVPNRYMKHICSICQGNNKNHRCSFSNKINIQFSVTEFHLWWYHSSNNESTINIIWLILTYKYITIIFLNNWLLGSNLHATNRISVIIWNIIFWFCICLKTLPQKK